MTEAVSAPTTLPRIPYRDIRLIRICATFAGEAAEVNAICAPFYSTIGGEPLEVRERVEALSDRSYRLRAIIAASPAQSREGLEAKARALLVCLSDAYGNEDVERTLARAVALDLLRLLGRKN